MHTCRLHVHVKRLGDCMVESLHSWRQWAWRWLSSDRPGTANVNGQATCAGRHRGYSETRDILNWLEIRMFETAGPTAQTAGTCIVAEHGRKIASAGLPRSRMSGPRVICAVSRVSGGDCWSMREKEDWLGRHVRTGFHQRRSRSALMLGKNRSARAQAILRARIPQAW